jgi:uncharacterized protein DUF2844
MPLCNVRSYDALSIAGNSGRGLHFGIEVVRHTLAGAVVAGASHVAYRLPIRTIYEHFANSLRVLALAAAALVWATPAAATLGGDRSSVESDRVRMQGALLRIASNGPYTLHEMRSATGIVVRQYLTSAGVVFGVAWQGPWMPDLRQLLGNYFAQYQSAVQPVQQNRRRHGPIAIEQAGLVIRIVGHARSFSGAVSVTSLVPTGVAAQSIR